MREMKRFIKRVDKKKRNINNSAYLGDLLVTAYSVFSRNRMLGNMVGKGYTVKAALMEMTMIAEGYYGAKTTYELSTSFNGEYPILQFVYQVLYEKVSAKKKMKALSRLLD
jgi:glycerol-3-phosphate dehydrogenase (NAD(P)+)